MPFKNGLNKVVTELSGVQSWSEIIVVISNIIIELRHLNLSLSF